MKKMLSCYALAAAAFVVSPQLAAQSTSVSPVVVVMSGLDNPRGLAFGPDGALYVAEAGRGPSIEGSPCLLDTSQPQIPGTSFLCVDSAGGYVPCMLLSDQFASRNFPDLFLKYKPACAGSTGAITRLWHGQQQRVATGLPSWAFVSAVGAFSLHAEGPNGVSMLGVGDAYVTVGLEGAICDAQRNCVSPLRNALGTGFGRLVRVILPTGHWHFVADLAEYEIENNLEPRKIDSNPFGVLAVPGNQIIVDAGGNDVLARSSDTGQISPLAVFLNHRVSCFDSTGQLRTTDGDGVPTSVALAPDGSLYVGQLTGVPLCDGAATIYRLDASADFGLIPACTGFKAIVSLAFDKRGNLYVLEIYSASPSGFAGPGAIYRIDAAALAAGVDHCDRASSIQVDTGGTRLITPTSIVVGPDEMLYVTNKGSDSSYGNNPHAQGEVMQIVPPID